MWPFSTYQGQKVHQVYKVDLGAQVWTALKEIEEIQVLEASLALKVNPFRWSAYLHFQSCEPKLFQTDSWC